MLRSRLYHYSDAYRLKGTILIANTTVAPAGANNGNKKIIAQAK